MDTLGNLLTQIRNAYMGRKTELQAPVSKLNEAVLRVLSQEGYIGAVSTETPETGRPYLKVTLKYDNRLPAVSRLRRISTPGQRIYRSSVELPMPKTGIGTILVSTPRGILTAHKARKERLGGEVLLEVIR